MIAPDLRGIGDSLRPADGYDLHSLTEDWVALLQALGVEKAAVVGFDRSLQSALMLALRHPERVNHFVLTESLAGRLPSAEQFLQAGPLWWFGFHSAPGPAENVLVGHRRPT